MQIVSGKDYAADLKRRASSQAIPIAAIFKRAKVAQSTFTRWAAGTYQPTFRTSKPVEKALADLIAERTSAAQAAG